MTLAAVLLLGTLGGMAGLAIDRAGYFDPPVHQPLEDRRALRNFRDSTAPIIGSAALGNGIGDIAIMRADGDLTFVDPVTGLLSSDRVPTGFASPPIGLSAGCGLIEPDSSGCHAPDNLHILSRDGGVAERSASGSWRIVLPDTAWTGLTGTRVQQAEVRSWAASINGQWVAVLAGVQGMAVFDTRNNRWLVPEGQEPLLAAGNVRVVAEGTTFWLIGGQGLGRVTLRSERPVLEWSPLRDFVVQDLSVSSSGARFAVVEGICETGAAPDCLRLAELTPPFTLRTLIGERERFADLSAAGLDHAQFQRPALVTLGAAGVHAYDPALRRWRVLLEGRVDAYYVAERGVILATQGNIVWRIGNGQVTNRRDAQGGPFVQILLAGDRALGLARDGTLRDLVDDSILLAAPADLSASLSFTTGASIAHRVLLLGPAGLLLHDADTRQYQWFPAAGLGQTPLLQQAGTRLYSTETEFWAVGREGAVARVVVGVGASVGVGGGLALADIGTLAGPLRTVTASGSGLMVVDANGTPWRAEANRPLVPTVGAPRQSGRRIPEFAARFGDGFTFAFADPEQIWTYDQRLRGWSGPFTPPPGTRLAGLSADEHLFTLTTTGDIWQTGTDGWQPTLTGGQAAIEFDALTDAAAQQGSVLFGGQGRVQRYDTRLSRFAELWQGGSGAVRIVASEGRQPVWLSGNRLFQGSNVLTDQPVRGAWAVDDGILTEIALPSGARYSMLFPRAGGRGAPVCTRYGARAPEGTLIDAIGLGAGRVLAATTTGLALHDPASRRWLTVRAPRLTTGERMHRAGDQLLVVSETGIRIHPLAQLQPPDSCAAPAIAVQNGIRHDASAVAYDSTGSRAALLSASGAVTIWSNGVLTNELIAATPGPRAGDILESAAAGPVYVAATAEAVWTYDSRSRVWARSGYSFSRSPGVIVDIGLSDVTETGAAVTAWTADGRSLGGDFRVGSADITLTEMSARAFPRINIPADAIDDVAERNGLLAVTSAARIEFGPLRAEALTGSLSLPDGIERVPYQWAGLTAFIAPTSARGEIRYLLPPQTDLTTVSGSLVDRAFHYSAGRDRGAGMDASQPVLWRIAGNGAILRCPVVEGQDEQTGCSESMLPPPTLQAADVISAAQTATDNYIATRGGLVVVNEQYRDMRPVPGPTPGPGSIFALSAGLLLFEGPGGALWRLQGAQARQIASGVHDAREWAGQLILDAVGTALVPPDDQTLTQLAATSPFVSFDWLGDLGFTLLDDQDRAVDGAGKPRLDLPLADRASIMGILPDPQAEGLWVHRANGTLELMRSGFCDRGPPHAPPVRCLGPATARPILDRGFGALIGVSRRGSDTVLSFELGIIAVSAEGELLIDSSPPLRFQHLHETGGPERIRSLIAIRPDGVGELAPPVLGRDISVAGVRIANLAAAAQRWDALGLDWLRWQRDDRRFSVPAVGGGDIRLAAHELMRDGRMILTLPGRGLRDRRGSGRYLWLTRHGLWSFDSPSSPPALVTLVETPSPLAVSASRFLFEGARSLDARSGALATDTNRFTVDFGDLRITEMLREQRVSARLRRSDGTETEGFAATGFVHDRREGIGWRDRSLVIVTPAGILPADRLQGVDTLPEGFLPRRVFTVAGVLHAAGDRGQWRHHDGQGRWSPTNDPFADRIMAREDGVIWQVSAANGLTLTPETAGQDWRVARQGLSFDLDTLISLAGRSGQVILGTRLGTHGFTDAASLAQASAPGDSGPVAAPFDALAATAGSPAVLFDANALPRVWDGAWRAPANASQTPWLSRVAVDTPVIRLTLARGAAPDARRRVIRPGGVADWAAFHWAQGQAMPFDRARALFAMPSALWIGTDFGLRRASSSGIAPDVFDISGGAPGAGLAAVTRLGRPQADPSQVLATGQGQGCALLGPTAVAGPCTAVSSLNHQRLHADTLWQWDIDNDRLSGRYVIDGSPSLPVAVSAAGFLTHDALRAAMACNGQSSELWADGQVVRTGSLSTRVPQAPGQGLLCQRVRAELGDGSALVPGAYLAGSRSFAIAASGALQPLTDPRLAQAVVERFDGSVALDRLRLRIRTGRFGDGYQYRRLTDQWMPLPFANGVPSIDVTTDFRHGSNGIDRLTPSGVVRHTLRRAALTIDPDSIVLRFTDDLASWNRCNPQRILRLDGDEHGVVSQAGAPALLRCTDGAALLETLPQADFGAFEPVPEDPTAATTLIDQGPWLWTRQRRGGAASIAIRFRDEPIDLAAGRFPMDALHGVAQVDAGRVDLVSEHGWWRHPASNLGADGATRDPRAPAPVEVRGLYVGQGGAGVAQLCLDLPDSQLMLSTPPRAVEHCQRWQGGDGFWTYGEPRGAAPQASANALNGSQILRTLAEGRFSDLVATGAPRPLGADLAVPVRDGVLILDAQRAMRGLYRFDGMLGLMPLGDSAANTLAATTRGLFALNALQAWPSTACPGLAGFLSSQPGLRLQTIERRGNAMQLLGSDATQATLAWSFDCTAGTAAPLNTVIDVAGRTRHVAHLQAQGEATRVLALRSDSTQGLVVSDGRDRIISFPNEGAGALLGLYGRTDGRTFLAVYQAEVFEIDSDAAISLLSRSRQAAPAATIPATALPTNPTSAPIPLPTSAPVEPRPRPRPQPTVAPTPAPVTPRLQPTPAPAPPAPLVAPLRRPSGAAPLPPSQPALEPGFSDDALVDLTRAPVAHRIAVQIALQRRGYYDGAIDGIIGPRSRAAIRAFQMSINAPADGGLTGGQFERLRAEGER